MTDGELRIPPGVPRGGVGDMADGGGRKRRPERVDEILDAAMRLFRIRGYHATTLEDVAREVGLAAPSLYRHVRGKSEILERALERGGTRVMKRVGEIAGSAAPPREVLSDLADNLIDVVIELPDLTRVIMRERHNLVPETRAWFERSQRMHTEEWVHALLQLRPELADSDARTMVRAVLVMLNGSQDLLPDTSPDRARRILHDLTMTALLGSPDPAR